MKKESEIINLFKLNLKNMPKTYIKMTKKYSR
jgi:hypothetical protein